ncbi:hypothetical protein P154DRAFT_535577 [Amniculicola lignicola CBS 123094]|uniref:Uncharacterized protein n=1 Tax=Amniculicola lignicola CBS 123094 TaxID=1392246 RepID=A0A6A5WBS9_9PLEO|nr:hypothetical protein P154DRAFT_535577 [Amniculicola lignicola CBS 123094]
MKVAERIFHSNCGIENEPFQSFTSQACLRLTFNQRSSKHPSRQKPDAFCFRLSACSRDVPPPLFSLDNPHLDFFIQLLAMYCHDFLAMHFSAVTISTPNDIDMGGSEDHAFTASLAANDVDMDRFTAYPTSPAAEDVDMHQGEEYTPIPFPTATNNVGMGDGAEPAFTTSTIVQDVNMDRYEENTFTSSTPTKDITMGEGEDNPPSLLTVANDIDIDMVEDVVEEYDPDYVTDQLSKMDQSDYSPSASTNPAPLGVAALFPHLVTAMAPATATNITPTTTTTAPYTFFATPAPILPSINLDRANQVREMKSLPEREEDLRIQVLEKSVVRRVGRLVMGLPMVEEVGVTGAQGKDEEMSEMVEDRKKDVGGYLPHVERCKGLVEYFKSVEGAEKKGTKREREEDDEVRAVKRGRTN